ncbi:fimbrial protein [Salmonella enterica subsp. enterica serovar Typhimurium]|nr:fimbrial protein [Salmonella enterica subsp. enterica serovar Typhimurium]
MKFTSALITLSVSAVLFSGVVRAAITGTDSVQMTFKTTVTTGTCKAIVVNGDGKNVSTIGYGETYKSDLNKKAMPLSIVFSNCSGVTIAEVEAKAGTGGTCSGDNLDGDSYAAGLNTAFEIWGGDADTGVKLSCKTPPAAQEVTITNGAGTYPMTSRIVVANGKSLSDVTASDVTAPVTFVVTYP